MSSLRPETSSSRPSSVPASTPSSPAAPTNDDIEAVIQMATSGRPSPLGPPKDTRTQLFVGNLPYRVRWQDLKDLFRKAGTVLRADVSLGPDNRSRGYGTVLLASAEDAGRAIDLYNGYSWQTRVLEVRLDRLPPDFDSASPFTGLGSPNPGMGYYGGFGMQSPMGGSMYGASPSSQGMMSGSTLGGMDDYNSLFSQERPTSSGGSNRSLFVGNLPFHCQWQDLKDLFRQAGTILRADVALGPDGRSRGFGTVSFANDIDADRAVKMFNGFEYNGRVLKVHFDRYSQSNQSAMPLTAPTSPTPSHMSAQYQQSFAHHQLNRPPSQIPMPPPGYQFEFLHSPGPSSPYGPPSHHYPPGVIGQGIPQHSSMEPSMSYNSTGELSMRANPPTPPSQANPASDNTSPTGSSSHSSTTQQHRPSRIALPPPSALQGFPMGPPHTISPSLHQPMSPQLHMHSLSPLHHPAHSPHILMTPHGLPPITPSMPSFNFAYGPPPTQSPVIPSASASGMNGDMSAASNFSGNGNGGMGGGGGGGGGAPMSPQFHHMMSPPMFTPGVTMSPGTPVFWGRNGFINAAVGAPVHAYSMGSPTTTQGEDEPASYFPPVPRQQDYFSTAPVNSAWIPGLGESGLRNEVMRDGGVGGVLGGVGGVLGGVGGGEKERPDSSESVVTTKSGGSVVTDRTGNGEGEGENGGGRSSSSVATSWHTDDGDGTNSDSFREVTERFGSLGLGGGNNVGLGLGPVGGLGGGKQRTSSMSSSRRPAPGPLQPSGGRPGSDPVLHPGAQSEPNPVSTSSMGGFPVVVTKSEGASGGGSGGLAGFQFAYI